MVDPIQYQLHFGGSERAQLMSTIELSSSVIRLCPCNRCDRLVYQHVVKPRFAGYTKINPITITQMTDHQYFLCDRMVEAFVYKIREWSEIKYLASFMRLQLIWVGHLDVVGFKKPIFDKSLFERLVLSKDTRDTIKKLTQMYIRGFSLSSNPETQKATRITTVHKVKQIGKPELTWSADMIEGKGEGLNILLHGRPGVGKTYTAGQ